MTALREKHVRRVGEKETLAPHSSKTTFEEEAKALSTLYTEMLYLMLMLMICHQPLLRTNPTMSLWG